VSNTHLDQAVSRLRNGTINEVARANVEATLALAYEQRTANLIAMWSNPEAKSGDATWGINESTIGAILQEILERLGRS
jgi:hypothetical protein